jgi:hypothetical protein
VFNGAMRRARASVAPVVAWLVAAAAVAGCLLPWERIEVRPLGEVQARGLDAFHGSGLAACIGAALALLMLADRLLRPRPSLIRDAGLAFAGALLITGAALFTATGGYRPGSAAQFEVALQPGLFVAGVAGVSLVLSAAIRGVWRRGGSRSPVSSE